MMVPAIHMNGTSGEALLEQNTGAAEAARELLRALVVAAPNGRDYYTQGHGALLLAEAEHVSRVARVESVLAELGELAEAIADANDKAGR